MEIKELIQACESNDHVILVLPRPKSWKGSDSVRLAGRSGPLGQINNVKESKDGSMLEVCATFRSKNILKALKDAGVYHGNDG